MTRPRGTSNSDARGNPTDRANRKRWLLTTFGDGTTAPCALNVSSDCQGTVTYDTITVDRYPVPGCEGGRYVHGNIRPACAPCNTLDGARLGNQRLRDRVGT